MTINTQNSVLISSLLHLLFVGFLITIPKIEGSIAKKIIDISFLYTDIDTETQSTIKMPSKDKRMTDKPTTTQPSEEHQKTTNNRPDILQTPLQQKFTDITTPTKVVTNDYKEITTKITTAQIQEPVGYSEAKISDKGQSLQTGQQTREVASSKVQTDNQFDRSAIIGAFINRIESAKQYPYIARRKGIEGTVLVSVHLSKEGEIIDLNLKKSSGYEILDTAAIDLLRRVCPFKHGYFQDLKIEIPITYRLVR